LNPTHDPVFANSYEIEWQVLAQGDSDLDATRHQVSNHLPESLITLQLQVHPQTVRVWLREGKLKGRLIGGRKSGYRIPASEIERLLSPDEPPADRRTA
jgi:hypothetical protein